MDLDAASIPLRELDRLWDFDDPAGERATVRELLERARERARRRLPHRGADAARPGAGAAAPVRRRPADTRRGRAGAPTGRSPRPRAAAARARPRRPLGGARRPGPRRVPRGLGAGARRRRGRHSRSTPPTCSASSSRRRLHGSGTSARWSSPARSADPVARRWVGSLANNMGWARHDAGDLDGAIALFEQSRDAFLADGRDDRARIARWSIARCLRSRRRRRGRARRAGGAPGRARRRSARRTATSSRRSPNASWRSAGPTRRARSSRAHTPSSPRIRQLRADEPERLKRLESLGHG